MRQIWFLLFKIQNLMRNPVLFCHNIQATWALLNSLTDTRYKISWEIVMFSYKIQSHDKYSLVLSQDTFWWEIQSGLHCVTHILAVKVKIGVFNPHKLLFDVVILELYYVGMWYPSKVLWFFLGTPVSSTYKTDNFYFTIPVIEIMNVSPCHNYQ